MSSDDSAPSQRVTVRRMPDRGSYDSDTVNSILDEGLMAHVGLVTAKGPVVSTDAKTRRCISTVPLQVGSFATAVALNYVSQSA